MKSNPPYPIGMADLDRNKNNPAAPVEMNDKNSRPALLRDTDAPALQA